MYYLDASAILKLIIEEKETVKLERFISDKNCTSKISRIEVMRVINSAIPEAAESAQRTLSKFDYVNISEPVIRIAESFLGLPSLRSLDSIHVASALSVSNEIEGIISYDKKMISNAQSLGLTVHTPV
jgi:predicted nucleic acid-binding protein